MGMSFVGVGSGLGADLAQMLQDLERAERMRLTPIVKQQQKLDTKISAYGKLKSALSTFSKATEKLQKEELFQSRMAKGEDKYFKITTNNEVPVGDYKVKVDQIAKAHSVASGVMKDNKAPLGNDDATRTITIEQKNGTKLEVVVGKDETSLQGIADAINNGTVKNEKGESVASSMNASVVRSGDGSYQLVVTSKETGTENTITSISTTDEKLNAVIGFGGAESGMTEISVAQDARFSLNGINITSGSNTIKDVVPGMDITLKGQTKSEETVSVSADSKKTKEALKEWVKAYNELQETFKSLSKFTKPEDKTGVNTADKKEEANGPLLGDSTLREIDQSIRSIFSHAQEGKFSVLSQVGINIDDKGKLVLDEKELEKALKDDPSAVSKLFTGDGDEMGIANELVSNVKQYIKSDGTLDTATKGLKASVKSLQQSYDRTEDSIQETLMRYRKQFTVLDSLVSSLNSTSQYLQQQFAAMSR